MKKDIPASFSWQCRSKKMLREYGDIERQRVREGKVRRSVGGHIVQNSTNPSFKCGGFSGHTCDIGVS